MKKNILTGLSATLLSLALVHAVPAYAMHQGGYKQACILKKIDEMKTSLGLTSEQEQQLQALKEKMKPMMEKTMREKHVIHEETVMLAEEGQVDNMKLDALAEKACQVEKEALKNRVMLRHEVSHILNPAQKEKLKQEMIQMHKEMMMKNNMSE